MAIAARLENDGHVVTNYLDTTARIDPKIGITIVQYESLKRINLNEIPLLIIDEAESVME